MSQGTVKKARWVDMTKEGCFAVKDPLRDINL